MTHWHYAMLEQHAEDMILRPIIGPEDPAELLTYEQAHREVQQLLDGLAAQDQRVRDLAEQWRAGAKDDTVYIGPRILTLYECPDDDCAAGYQTFVNEWQQILRQSGLTVDVHQPPQH